MAFSVTIAIGAAVFAADRMLDDIMKFAVAIRRTDHTPDAIRNPFIFRSHDLRQMPPDVMGPRKS
jgi:hypothetical protein